MSTSRLWTFGSVLVIVALLAGTWFIGISPRLEEASTANETRETVAAQNQIQSVKVVSLKQQFEKIEELRGGLDELRSAIPADADLADLIGEVNSLATAAGVAVTSVAFADPIAYAPAEKPTEDPQLLGALESVSPENFFAVPVQLSVTGSYAQAMGFVTLLQSGERFFLVHDLALTSGIMSNEAPVELGISGQVFVLLDPSDIVPPADSGPATATVPPVESQPAPK